MLQGQGHCGWDVGCECHNGFELVMLQDCDDGSDNRVVSVSVIMIVGDFFKDPPPPKKCFLTLRSQRINTDH